MRIGTLRRVGTSLLLGAFALLAFVVPGFFVLASSNDPAHETGEPPRAAFFWHRSLSARYAPWARARIASGRAGALSQQDISGTEWPLFGTVFYLLATEELEAARAKDPSLGAEAPSVYARAALDAAAELLADPVQATWVQAKYGNDYRHKENVFYRYLLILGFTSYERITRDTRYHDRLRDQSESLAAELLASPAGLLEDYPGECYPSDVLWAVAAIRRSDAVLGTDHRALVARTVEKFQSPTLLGPEGLPPYTADKTTGRPIGGVRGCSSSSILTFAPELDRDLAAAWWTRHERRHWQEKLGFAGFREFAAGDGIEWYADVDAGPVVAGFGVSACAFGIGAARANGRLDRARTLAGEALAWAWPLPDGSLLVPSVLSNQTDAPLLGEAAVLFNLTRRPAPGVAIVAGGSHAPQLALLLGAYFGAGLATLLREAWRWRRAAAGASLEAASPRRERAAFGTWISLLVAAIALAGASHGVLALLAFLASAAVPEAVAGRARQPGAAGGTPSSPSSTNTAPERQS